MTDIKSKIRGAASKAKVAELVETPHDPRYDLPKGCPVTPLGVSGEIHYYLNANKQMIPLAAGDHARTRLMALFGADTEFIYTQPQWCRMKDGNVTGWKPEVVAEDFMRQCSRAGIWDPVERLRGRGAWRGEDGDLIVHTGDQIMSFPCVPDPWRGRSARPPGRIGRYVYPTSERVGVPGDIDCSADRPAEQLLDLFETWQWRRGDLDAILLLGWVGAAMIGGALKWRPSVWLTGGRGTGKSSLQEAIHQVLDHAVIAVSDTSPAYLWQTLKNQTLPVAVDELEADERNERQLAVVRLARIAASGGKLGRGSDRHAPLEFTLRSTFMFSSILIPPISSADRSRLAILDLNELPIGAPLPDLTPARLRALGAALRRRMVDGWSRLEDTLEMYRRQLAATGHGARGADQFGTLLACADLLLWNGTDEDAAADWVRRLSAADLSETADNLRDEDQCLQHLLATPIDPFNKRERVGIGEWINRALGRSEGWQDSASEARKALAGYGIRIERVGAADFVAVANMHSGLCTVFDDTRWKTPKGVSGTWTQTIRRLAGAQRGEKALYFGGAVSKATLLPLELIPAPDGTRQPHINGV